ncbi:hypothetical protein ACIGO9_28530 [Nocardia asteroides]|uniref:hypothetical protein n=1 Tax=Nocardia asteroides TaxID=1824 RepID=UPI0037C5E077
MQIFRGFVFLFGGLAGAGYALMAAGSVLGLLIGLAAATFGFIQIIIGIVRAGIRSGDRALDGVVVGRGRGAGGADGGFGGFGGE